MPPWHEALDLSHARGAWLVHHYDALGSCSVVGQAWVLRGELAARHVHQGAGDVARLVAREETEQVRDVVGFTIAEFIPREVIRLRQFLAGFPR